MTLLANRTEEKTKLREKITLDDDKEELSKIKLRNKEREEFDLFLNNEQDNFDKEFHNKYSKEFIEEYSLKSFNSDNAGANFLVGSALFFFLLFATVVCSSTNPIMIILSAILLLSSPFIIINLKPVQKMVNRKNLKKQKNIEIIKKKIFSDMIVDNKFLKQFINVYGEDFIRNILIDKDNVTYGDILEYRKKFKEEDLKKEKKKKKVDEIIKCIASS